MPSAQLREEYSHIIHLRSEPARLLLICRLKQGPMDAASLIEATGFSQASISRPFGQLQRANLAALPARWRANDLERCRTAGGQPLGPRADKGEKAPGEPAPATPESETPELS
jgi:hypothetical protein